MKLYEIVKKYLILPKEPSNKMDHYERARLWSDDVYSHAVIWRNWSLLIAICALLITLFSLVLLFSILPLKENTPFLIFVDNERGEPVTIKPILADELIENESLKRYMIRKFVIARERYHQGTINEDKHIVSVLSSPDVFQDYQGLLDQSNPLSPQNLYKNSQVDLGGIKIMFLNENRAYVSFILVVTHEGGIKEISANADIKFDFSNKDFEVNDAHTINPVNFEVLSYQSHHQNNLEVSL